MPHKLLFNSEYYTELVGGDRPDDDMATLVNDAPKWRRAVDPRSSNFPERRVWEGHPVDVGRIVMVCVSSGRRGQTHDLVLYS